MPQHLSFGIGCYHFSYHPADFSTATGKRYLEVLNGTLSAIANITEIEIQADEFFDGSTLTEKPDSISEGPGIFPYPSSGLDITFNIFISARLHSPIVGAQNPNYSAPEHFKVYIFYSFYFPATFVVPINAPDDYDASESVVICREFISEAISKIPNCEINFEILGPSPFHADFFLVEDTDLDDTSDFEAERIEQHGYDIVSFGYSAALFPSIDVAWEYLRRDLRHSLEVFYSIVNTDVFQSHEWQNISAEIQSLIEVQQQTGIRSFWKRAFRSPSAIHSTTIKVAAFESFYLSQNNELAKRIKEITKNGESPILLHHIQKEFEEMSVPPFKQTRDILSLLENRSSKRVDSIIVILSALLGGTIGSVLTALWQK